MNSTHTGISVAAWRRSLVMVAGCLLAWGIWQGWLAQARAGRATSAAFAGTTITVNDISGGTGGPGCKLRDAITAANNNVAVGGCPAGTSTDNTAADVIVLPANGIISLISVDNTSSGANGLPTVTSFIEIRGNGSVIERVTTAPAFRLFNVTSAGNLRIYDAWLRNGINIGTAGQNGGNGGIAQGGGIRAAGALLLDGCTISNCEARGGDGTVAGGAVGGAIYSSISLSLTQCTISGNRAVAGTSSNGTAIPGLGGGVFTANSGALYASVTSSDNSASVGGSLYAQSSASQVFYSVASSIFANSPAGVTDVYFAAQGTGSFNKTSAYNLAELDAVGANALANLGVAGDPKLGPLQINGPGNVPTHALLAGSPAIDRGQAQGQQSDQRKWPRTNDDPNLTNAPNGGGTDIGAYEKAYITTELTTTGDAFAGSALNRALTAKPLGPTYALSLAQGSSLPPGVSLSNGVLVGTPLAIGTYTFNITATNGNESGTTAVTLKVVCSPSMRVIGLINPTAGQSYSGNFTATPTGTYSFAITSGNLPPGLTLASDGTVSGIPLVAGTFNYMVQASGWGGCSISSNETMTVNCPTLAVSPSSLPEGKTGTLYNQPITTLPAAGTYNYALTDMFGQPSTTALPPGMTLSATGVLGGTPTQAGTYSFGVYITNFTSCTRTMFYTLTIRCGTYTFTVDNLTNATAGLPYSQAFALNNAPAGTTYTISTLPPPGLTFNNGTLSGTPTSQGTYFFSVEATSYGNCKTSKNYSLNVQCPTMTLNDNLAGGTVGQPYSQTLTASPSSATYEFVMLSGSLPSGLTLNRATGEISGTPGISGTFTFSVDVRAFGCSTNFIRTLVIGCPTTTVTPSLPNGTVGTSYNQSFSVTPAGTYTYTPLGGQLPPGLSLSNNSLSGTPQTSGTFTFQVRISGATICPIDQSYTVTISCPTLNYVASLPHALTNTVFSQPVFSGVATGYSFSVPFGSLPPGLTLQSNGTLNGTPTLTGEYIFTIRATLFDCMQEKTFTQLIGCPTITLAASVPNGTAGTAYQTTQVVSLPAAAFGFTATLENAVLPQGLTFNSNGSLSGTPSVSGNFFMDVLVSSNLAAACPPTRKRYNFSVGCPTLTVSTGTTPNGTLSATVNTDFTQTLTASPAGGNYRFELATGSTLPAGLTLALNGTLSGKPTTGGTFNFTVKVTGWAGCTATLPITMNIACPTTTVSAIGGTVAPATAGTTYSQSFTASPALPSGQSYSFALNAGSTLPAGLTLAANGTLSGTPTAGGTHNFTIKATANGTCTGTLPVTLTVGCPTFTITPNGGTVAPATAGTAYSQSFTASPALVAGQSYSFNLATGSTLPAGLTLAPNGTLSGTPTTSGTYNFTLQATAYASCKVTLPVTLTVNCPTLTLGNLPDATTGTAYAQTISVTPATGSYTFAVTSGSLPPGLTLAANGTLSGTATLGGAYTFTVQATGLGSCADSRTYTLQVGCTPTLGNYPNATVNQGGNLTVTPSAAPIGSTAWMTASAPGFGGSLTVNAATGVVTVSNAQVPGTYTVTVRAQGGCPGKTFTLTVTPVATCANADGLLGNSAATDSNPMQLAHGDFNGDGKLDVVTANGNLAGTLSVLLGKGDNTFKPKVDYVAGQFPNDVTTADFNGDGKLDLAATLSNLGQVGVLKGNGDGTFQAVQGFAVGTIPVSLVAGDFDGDGKYDLAAANSFSKSVSVLRGNGDGTFQAKVDYAIGTSSTFGYSLVSGDFNGDNKTDLLAATNETALSLLCGNGDGTFKAKQNIAVGFNVRWLGVGDFNGDGKADVVAPQVSSTNYAVLRGNGDATFTTTTGTSTSFVVGRFAVADINGDGKLDFAFPDFLRIVVMAGNGDGTFQTQINSSQQNGQVALAAGDFNGDQRLELVTANGYSNGTGTTISVYRQNVTPVLSQNNQTPMQHGGTALDGVVLATITDCDDDPTALTAKINNATSVSVNGVNISNLAIQPDGKITARVAMDCAVTSNNFLLTMTDNTGAVKFANLNIQARGNNAPYMDYPNSVAVPIGQSTTITPTVPLTDDYGTPTVSVVGVTANFGGPFAGTVTVTPTGVVSLNNVSPAGFYQVVIRATDHCGYATDRTIYFNAQCPTLTLGPSTLPSGLVGKPYSTTLTATGGVAPYTFAVRSGASLPPGFTLSPAGVLSGTPAQAGGQGLGLMVTDAQGCSFNNNLYLEIINNSPPQVTPSSPQVFKGENNRQTVFGQLRDDRTPLSALTIRQVAGGTATGLTISNVRLEPSIWPGNYFTGDTQVACNATSGTVCFEIVDGDGAITKTAINYTVKDTGVSLLRYDNQTTPMLAGQSTTVNPAYGFSNPQFNKSVVVQSITSGFTGTATVTSNGQVSINNAAPAGTYTVTIRATDHCDVVRDASFTFTVNPIPWLISEWRMSGPNGTGDWYVELYNNTDQPQPTDGLGLFGQNLPGSEYVYVELTGGRTVPPRGHYLIAGPNYSITQVPPDDTFVPEGGDVGLLCGWLLTNATGDFLSRAGTTDALSLNADYLYENTPVPALGAVKVEYAWVRKNVSATGLPQNTNNNLNDFVLVATATNPLNGITPRPGAPGPQNSASPLVQNAGLPVVLFRPSISSSLAPNTLVESVPVTMGTATYARSLYLRRTITNNLGQPVTKLRFNIAEISNGGVNTAILRVLSSDDFTIERQAVKGLTLETPPDQPTGGGLNSSLSAGSITLATPLAPGAKVNVQFRLGIVQGGSYRFFANIEAIK